MLVKVPGSPPLGLTFEVAGMDWMRSGLGGDLVLTEDRRSSRRGLVEQVVLLDEKPVLIFHCEDAD